MGLRDTGYDIAAIAADLGIRDKLLFTATEPGQPRISDEDLNVVYNACDVGLNTSTGEGWAWWRSSTVPRARRRSCPTTRPVQSSGPGALCSRARIATERCRGRMSAGPSSASIGAP
jgi:hypothetical protein